MAEQHDKQHEQKAQTAAAAAKADDKATAAPARTRAERRPKVALAVGNDAYAKGARAAEEGRTAKGKGPKAAGRPKREKDTRQVLRGVLIGGHVYGRSDADKDKLEEMLTREEVERLTEKGVLAGDWKPQGTGERPRARPRSVEGAGMNHLERRIAELEAKLAKAGK